jgi:chitinase
LIIGLPAYGHTYQWVDWSINSLIFCNILINFSLVNPFNTRIGAPADNFGESGYQGFTSYSDVCNFRKRNVVVDEYDEESCSPFLHAGSEWISYDNEKSLECKTKWIKENQFGGAMVFSLNSDDYLNDCNVEKTKENFPLLRKVYHTLFRGS